jgi:hypothetical protein
MNSTKNTMKMETNAILFRDEINSMKIVAVRTYSIPMKQNVHFPESKQSRVRMREHMNTCDVATTSTAVRMKVPISMVRMGLVPLPNVNALRAKVDTLRSIRHKLDGDHVKTYT